MRVCVGVRLGEHRPQGGKQVNEAVATPYICVQCGVQFSAAPTPPEKCPICEDERQAVHWDGQQWTTLPIIGRLLTLNRQLDLEMRKQLDRQKP